MVNKYLECLAVDGNYSKARIGLLVLGIFSLSVFIWLIVLTVQLGNASKESAGGDCVDLTGTWHCNITEEKNISYVYDYSFVQKKCVGAIKSLDGLWDGIFAVSGDKVTVMMEEDSRGTDSGVVNKLVTEIKIWGTTCRKESGPVTSQTTEKPATTAETPACKTKLEKDTETNPVSGKDCIFPFKYKEISHKRCTKVNTDFFWCATKVDKNGKMEEGQWGQCDDICNKEGDPVKCYNCKKNDQPCFKDLKKGKVVECKNGNVCYNETIKIPIIGDGNVGGCLKLPTGKSTECFSAGPYTTCYCDYDLCNAA